MKLVLAGASGFLGTALTAHLQAAGHEVTRLVRRPARDGESQWDPYAGTLDTALIEETDVVVNLAGASLAHFPWTASYRRTFSQSRLSTTSTIAAAIARSERKPAFLAQNGIAGYGDRGDDVVTESDPTDADSFLGSLTEDWAAAAAPAAEAGARVVFLRTAVVVDRSGGVLKSTLPLFRLGLGGPIGTGGQYFPTISLDDWLRSVTYLAETDSAHGAYNLTGPAPSTNAEYTKSLARRLRRPAFLRVPAWPLRLLARPVAPELLNSVRLEPKRLLDEGFAFHHATLDSRLDAALSR